MTYREGPIPILQFALELIPSMFAIRYIHFEFLWKLGRKPYYILLGYETATVVCKKVHPIGSVWCKMALGEVGVSLP